MKLSMELLEQHIRDDDAFKKEMREMVQRIFDKIDEANKSENVAAVIAAKEATETRIELKNHVEGHKTSRWLFGAAITLVNVAIAIIALFMR